MAEKKLVSFIRSYNSKKDLFELTAKMTPAFVEMVRTLTVLSKPVVEFRYTDIVPTKKGNEAVAQEVCGNRYLVSRLIAKDIKTEIPEMFALFTPANLGKSEVLICHSDNHNEAIAKLKKYGIVADKMQLAAKMKGLPGGVHVARRRD